MDPSNYLNMPKQKYSKQKKARSKGRQPGVPRAPAGEAVHVFARSVSQAIPINQLYGINSAGFDMAISVSLAQMAIVINGAPTFAVAVPGYTDFTALFDQYQIRAVSVDVFWSKNIAGEATAAYSLPLLWSALDYDDTNAITKGELQQYPDLRMTSMGENGGKVFQQRFRPVPRLSAPDGAGGTGFSPTLDKNAWFDVTYPQIAHNGIKFYLETFGRSSNIDLGSLLVCARVDYAFKHQR